jgi:hypothetical protein
LAEKSGVSWGTVTAVLVILGIVGAVFWFGSTIIGAIAAL